MPQVKLTRLLRSFLCGLSLVCLASYPREVAGQNSADRPARWEQVTHASWYGNEFAGRPTAAGGRFNPEHLTAAHRTLALGSWVKVTDLHTKRYVVVKITDRGPFARNRGIDLSYGAARHLGMVRKGIARVHVELVYPDKPRELAQQPQVALASCAGKPLLQTNFEWWSPNVQCNPEARRPKARS